MRQLKKQSGITLITLIVMIIVVSITTGTVITTSSDSLKVKNLNNLYADIKSLNDSVFAYYNKYGTLPVSEEYTVDDEFYTIKNVYDNETYQVIDENKLNRLILTKKLTWENDDVYIINTKTHTIYYPKGVTFENEKYYSLPLERGIPISNEEELSKIGTGQKATIYGKEYTLLPSEKYILTSDIVYTGDYSEIISRIEENNIEIVGNEHEIEVTTNGVTDYYVEEYNYCKTKRMKELIFANQSINKIYSTELQTANIKAVSDGTGIYTYTEVSEQNSVGTETSYISISGAIINIAANTPAGVYTYLIRATDSNSGAIKDATYTITVGKQALTPVTNLEIGTNGKVTWNQSSNSTGYEISIDNNNWTRASSGIDYLEAITAESGSRTVYVRAINNDNENYITPSANATKTVRVVTLTTSSANISYGTVDNENYNVISGATYEVNNNTILIKSGETLLKTITATKQDAIGYTTEFSNWSSTSGTISEETTVMANFERNADTYSIGFTLNGGTVATANPTSYTVETDNITLNNPTKTGYTFTGWSGTGLTGDTNTAVTIPKGSTGNKTYTANWMANTYTIAFDGNGNNGGSMSNLAMTYDTAKALTTNTYTKTGYTFAGWSTSASDTAKIYDNTETTGTKASGESGYSDFKQYYVDGQFASGDVYQLEVDVKGSGTLRNYFYGGTNYLRVASWTSTTAGTSGTSSDGNNQIPLTSSYTHYTVRFTLGSTGDGSVQKYILFRAMPGCTASIKNVRFFKVSSNSKAYIDGQTVKNLAASGTANLYAIWSANPLTFANQTVTKTFSTSAQTQAITAANNGTGTYTYSEVSEKNSSGTATSYISISGATISIAANTPAGTYTYVIRATDSNSKATKDATYTITVNKATPTVTLSATSGSVNIESEATFTATPNLTGKWNVTSGNARYVTISSPVANAPATANTATTIKYTGVAVTTSAVAITVKFTPTNTNYNEVSKTFNVTVNESNGIPTAYQKVEYIQANGTQWIDTGVPLNGNFELYMDGCMLESKSGVLLNGYASAANRMGMTFFATSNKVGYYWFGAGYRENTNLSITLTQRFQVVQNRSSAHIYQGSKRVNISYSGATTFYSGMNIYIFNTAANANYKNGTIYEAIISDTTTYDDATGEYKEIRHFIPCKRKNDGVIGLYDTVGNKFYTNSGTGTFVAGPNV